MKAGLRWLLITIVAAVIILVIVLISLSFSSLESTEVGLKYNSFTKSLDEKTLYTAGNHNVGPSGSFKKYDTSVQTLTFDNVETRTNDGLSITINVSFQYRIESNIDAVLKIFKAFPEQDHESAYKNIAENLFRDVCSKYETYSFISNRNDIQSDMYTEVYNALAEYSANILNFQLLEISYPSAFQNVINEAQEADLLIDQVDNEIVVAQNAQTGALNSAETSKQTYINTASQQASQIGISAAGSQTAIETRLDSTKQNDAKLVDDLSYGADQLINLEYMSSINKLTAKNLQFPVNFQKIDLP